MEDTSVLIITRQMMLDELNKMPPGLKKHHWLAFKLQDTNRDIHPYQCKLRSTGYHSGLLHIAKLKTDQKKMKEQKSWTHSRRTCKGNCK